jgi:poly-gamma-glutamate synthesis protein (capsule biosynthesis protein)
LKCHTHVKQISTGCFLLMLCRYDEQQLQQQLAAAQASGPDIVVVMMHWGPNWRWTPDQHLRKLGRAFLEAGADIVFGTSPHHIQVTADPQ